MPKNQGAALCLAGGRDSAGVVLLAAASAQHTEAALQVWRSGMDMKSVVGGIVKRFIHRDRPAATGRRAKTNIDRKKRQRSARILSKEFRIPRRIDFLGDAPIVTELWMVDILSRLIDQESVFVDVGVNRAQTLLKVKAVSPRARYIGIEPVAESVAFTNEVIRANGISNCSLICAALADVDSEIAPLVMKRGVMLDSMAALHVNSESDEIVGSSERYETRLAACMTFDSIHAHLDRVPVDVIKIDVEGAEMRVLTGMSRLLDAFRPFVLLEVLPLKSLDDTRGVENQIETGRIFSRNRYHLFRIKKANKAKRVVGLEIPAVWPFIHSGGSKSYRDYLAVPEEKLNRVRDWVNHGDLNRRESPPYAPAFSSAGVK